MDDLLDRLTPEQYAAAVHENGPACVLAGAGTGKTSVIAAHVRELVRRGVAPERILLLTFTNKAARELAHRAGVEGVVSGTFHSVASRLCREFGSPSDSFRILDEDDSYRLWREVVGSGAAHGKRPAKELHESHDALMAARDAGLIDGPVLVVGAEPEPGAALAREYARAYADRLESIDGLDFPGLLLALLGLCQRRDVQSRFSHVIVDEYQDTSPLQDQIITALARHHGNPYVVGDDGQAIYAWRGADPKNIMEFDRRWPTATLYKLQGNFRSGQAILGVANAITAHGADTFGKRLFAMRSDGAGKVVQYSESDTGSEARRIVGHVKKRIGGGAALDSHAILCRAAYQFRPIEVELVRAEIPYRVAGGPSLTARAESRDAIAYLRAWADHTDDLALGRILNVPTRGIGERSAALLGGRRLWDSLRQVQGAGGALGALLKAGGLSAAGSTSGVLKGPAAAGALALVRVLDSTPEQERAADVLRRLLAGVSYRDHAARDEDHAADRCDTLDQLELLLESVAGTKAAVSRWCRDVAVAETQAKNREAVVLSTMHAAKGLEWQVVYAPGWEENTFPSAKGDPDEERRIAYVAVTRARDLLIVGCVGMRHGETRTPGLHWHEVRDALR